ncbi:LysR family transcriptional regulator [Pseudomonas sp. Marseille-Q8238]
MDRLKAMATFVRIVETGSLSAAADALGQSAASVVRSLAALEKHLGVRLLNRNTRRLALTDEGAEYLAWSRRMLAEFDTLEQRFEARQQDPGGLLRLTAPVAFGQRHVAPLVNEFLRAHPGMQVELTLLDRTVDLLEEGLDLAIRIGHLPDSSMTAITLGATRHVVCVHPGLLQAGPIKHPATLRERDCIVFAQHGPCWAFLEQGQALSVEVSAKLLLNQVEVARAASIEGMGVVRLLHYQVADALADERLVRLLRAFETPDVPIQMVYPHSRLLSPRVRRFIDWAAPRLKASIPDPS